MTLLTIITIATNFPDNIKIASGFNKDENKWAAFIYLLDEDKNIDRLVIDTLPVYDSEELANERMGELCEWCIKYLDENEVFDA